MGVDFLVGDTRGHLALLSSSRSSLLVKTEIHLVGSTMATCFACYFDGSISLRDLTFWWENLVCSDMAWPELLATGLRVFVCGLPTLVGSCGTFDMQAMSKSHASVLSEMGRHISAPLLIWPLSLPLMSMKS